MSKKYILQIWETIIAFLSSLLSLFIFSLYFNPSKDMITICRNMFCNNTVLWPRHHLRNMDENVEVRENHKPFGEGILPDRRLSRSIIIIMHHKYIF